MFWLAWFISVLLVIVFTLLWVRRKIISHFNYQYSVVDKKQLECLERVKIGGIDQCFHVRGRDASNPFLLFIHGGPAWTHIGWFDDIQRPWEDFFTVVQWDQRQAGKSYIPHIGDTVSHKKYLEDTSEMIAYLRKRFNVEKIFLMGTSYGSYLGAKMAFLHPNWLYAYIGVGQVVKMTEHATAEYELLLSYAKANQNTELVRRLEALAPFPDPASPEKSYYDNVYSLMEEESRLGKAYPGSVSQYIQLANFKKLFSPHYTLTELIRMRFKEKDACADPDHPFYKDFFNYDLPAETGSKFDVPIFFFTGAHDFHVAYTVTDDWFKTLQAPYKEQVWFEQSAHVPHQEQPYEFLKAMVEKVRPLSARADKAMTQR